MAEVTTPEKPVRKEEPSLSAFDQIQTFLKEKGQLVNNHKLEYQRHNIWFLSQFSFPNIPPQGELIKNMVDLTITQQQTVSSDSPPSDIEIIITHRGQLKVGEPIEGKPQDIKQINRIVVVNPQSGKEERIIIEPLNPLNRWLGLSKEKWQKTKNEHNDHWFSTSEEEAKRVIDQLMMSEETHRVGRRITNEPKISRRGFLALMGLGAKAAVLDSLLTHIPGTPSLSKAFWEQLETATLGVTAEQLKKEIEDRFQIQLVSPATGVPEVEYNNEKKYPTIEWDNPRLKSLIRVLSELPPHLYSPRSINDKEHKISFVLTDVPFWGIGDSREGKYQGGFCACRAAEAQLIVLDKKNLGQTFLETSHARETWVHEITHALTSPEIQKYVDSIGKPIGIGRLSVLRKTFASQFTVKSRVESERRSTLVGSTSWIEEHYIKIEGNRYVSKEVFNRSGGDIDYFRTGNKGENLQMVLIEAGTLVSKQAVDSWGEDHFKTPPPSKKDIEDKEDRESEREEIKHKSPLGYGAQNFYEFFSVAAEFYSKGRDEFVSTYEPFLGREKAEKLYEGMKLGIFQGKEY